MLDLEERLDGKANKNIEKENKEVTVPGFGLWHLEQMRLE